MTSIPAGAAAARNTTAAPTAGRSGDLLAAVERTRSTLQMITWLRALLLAVAAAVATWIVMTFASRQAPISPIVVGVVVLFMMHAVLFASLRRAARVSAVRAALWLEEQSPAGFSLVTLVEQSVASLRPDTEGLSPSVRDRLADAYYHSVGGASHATKVSSDGLARLAVARLRDPLLFTVAAIAVSLWLRASPAAVYSTVGIDARTGTNTSGTDDAASNTPIGAWSVRVQPPAYTKLPPVQLGDVDGAKVLSGSTLTIVGRGPLPSAVTIHTLVDSSAAARKPGGDARASTLTAVPVSSGWSVALTTASVPAELRVARGRATRLLLIEGYADSIPRVSLRIPARDTVLRTANGRLPLEAALHDDLGLALGAFEMIISSGEGERFTARTVRVGAQRLGGAHDATLRLALDLDSMKLGAGDIVHLRAVALDGHPAAGREWGSSETRSLRVARAAEYDSVSVEPAPPPEVDKSLLSQRMLLLMTEKLEARRSKLAAPALAEETSKLARDQTRLRLAVGDAVFQRLGNESSAEHAEGGEKGIKIVDGKLVMPPDQDMTGMLEEGDDSPVIGINKPLLEAYNAMWDAARVLELSDRKGAIPHMRVALAAIERARAASRLYLRGKPPVVILDLDKIRLAGKDTGVTNVRSVRAPMAAKARDREARLLRGAALAVTDAAAARDSVAVLRLESVGDAPAFAEALSALVDALRRGGDVTGEFVRARRVLGGVTRASGAEWSRVPPQ